LQNIAKQAKSNVQPLIESCTNIMLHQMKGINNGQQDVEFLIPKIWKNIQK
jgi:hypothetical protein